MDENVPIETQEMYGHADDWFDSHDPEEAAELAFDSQCLENGDKLTVYAAKFGRYPITHYIHPAELQSIIEERMADCIHEDCLDDFNKAIESKWDVLASKLAAAFEEAGIKAPWESMHDLPPIVYEVRQASEDASPEFVKVSVEKEAA